MTTLHCITGLRGGGAEHQLVHLLEGGLAKGGNVHVLSLTDRGVLAGRIEQLGVPVHTLGLRYGMNAAFRIMRFRRLLKEITPTIVQGWMYHGNLFAWMARRMTTISPAVAWNIQHSLHELATEKFMMRLVIRGNRLISGRADAVVYNSHVSRSQHEAFGFKGDRSMVIPNGFDLTRFEPDAAVGRRMRREMGIPSDAIVVGHMARLHPMKNHVGFLQASICAARESSKIHVVLVGRGVEPENLDLSELVPIAMRPRFHFVGERVDVPDVMRMLDVLCCSSSWGEASPNVLGEAMASGVPCVTTDVGDSGDIVGATGVVVPAGSIADLASGLERVLSMSVSERATLGDAARKRIEELYEMSGVVMRYRLLYQSLAPSGGE